MASTIWPADYLASNTRNASATSLKSSIGAAWRHELALRVSRAPHPSRSGNSSEEEGARRHAKNSHCLMNLGDIGNLAQAPEAVVPIQCEDRIQRCFCRAPPPLSVCIDRMCFLDTNAAHTLEILKEPKIRKQALD